MDAAPAEFENHRRHLTALAYRMLGSVAEAEDAVQDAYLRWHRSDLGAVNDPRAYLTTVVTRLCLDRLKAARRQRETYVGAWLPEPIVEGAGDGAVADEQRIADDVSFTLMLTLERLSPLERAAFLLHDVFDMSFAEVAAALGRGEAACRQLASRARARVKSERPRFAASPDENARLAAAFFEASRNGNTAELRRLLASDAVLHSDGGGRKPAALNPIVGADKVCRFYDGLLRKGKLSAPVWSRNARINGLPGVISVERDGTLQTVAVEMSDGQIAGIYVVRNPEKLGHVAPMVPR